MNDTPETPREDPDTRAPEGGASQPDAPENTTREGERIAKLLARAGIASRREVERMIAEGRVRLNDVVIDTPATVLTSLRGVTVDGRPVARAEGARLFIFHKPAGLLTAERDPAGRATIYTALRNALPPGSPRVMPIGRLDLNTEGLLLLTNDGELKRAMELPASGIPRTYRARTFGDITQAQLEELIDGIEIEGVRYGSIDANMERRTGRNQWVEMTLKEGKNREVRRVLEHLGLQVSRLIRVRYGPFELGDMPRGAVGEIAPSQVERYRREIGLPPSEAAAERPAARLAPRANPRAAAAGAAPVRARGPMPGQQPAKAPRRKADPARPDERAGRRTAPWASPARDPENIERRERNQRADRAERAERSERRARRDAGPARDSAARPLDRGERAARPPRPSTGERRENTSPRAERGRDERPRQGSERAAPGRSAGERPEGGRRMLSPAAPGRAGPGRPAGRSGPGRDGPQGRGSDRRRPGPKPRGPRK